MASILSYLDGPRDEERIAGLLLLAKREEAMTEAIAVEAARKSGRFLERLLGTAEADAAMSAAQRVGVAVATQLANFGAASVLGSSVGDAVASIVEAHVDRSEWTGDLVACVECAAALRAGSTTAILEILLRCPADREDLWRGALRAVRSRARDLPIGDRSALLKAAEVARSSKERYGWEASLLSLVVASWIGGGDLVKPELRSSEARRARDDTKRAVFAAAPRLLARGGVPEWQRDDALRLAALAAKTFGGFDHWLGGQKRSKVLVVLARVFSAEARLALDEALALCAFDEATAVTPDEGQRSDRVDRVTSLAPLCLGFLERLVDALVLQGGDSDSDSDDRGTVDDVDPEVLLEVRGALNDAIDVSLAFATEVRLHYDDDQQRNKASVPDFALALCRDAFRYLGRLALDLDDDDDDDGGENDEHDAASIHRRLAELRPFVSQLMSLDAAPQPPPSSEPFS